MSIQTVLILVLASLLLGLFSSGSRRTWLLAASSVLAVYWLQPASPIRNLDYWLPTLTLAAAAAGWVVTTPPSERRWRQSLPALAGLAGLILGVAVTRYISLEGLLTASRPPSIGIVVIGLAVLAPGIALPVVSRQTKVYLAGAIVILLTLFLMQKTPQLSLLISRGLRSLNGQDPSLAGPLDWRWLGFSFIAFRLIHTIRDRQAGRLPVVTFPEFLTFIVFFPTLPAGPLDRLERFVPELRATTRLDTKRFLEGGQRVVLGLFKKFVIADLLSLSALNAQNASQVHSGGWMWVVLYAYAFQIFFDFSGYTDIALGMGRWLGIRLPENFDRPYLQSNLNRFWNKWHMSLTQWFRAYYFSPLTRSLLRSRRHFPAAAVMLFGQVTTMVVIGLWHGVTWNFLFWGLWHGLGLFVQNRWSAWSTRLLENHHLHPWMQRGLSWAGIFLTFHYVTLGWVWFVIPDSSAAFQVFARLAGG